MDFIATNLKFLRKQRKWTQNDLGEALNIKRSLVGAYEEDRARPSYETLYNLSQLFKYSIDHLITKDLRQTEKVPLFDPSKLTNDPTGKDLRVLAVTVNNKEKQNIEMVPVQAAAGYLAGYSDPDFIKELEKFRLPFLPNGTFRAFEIKGDSMLPIHPGSVIIGEYLENWKHIKDGHAYIILSKNDGIVFKRVFNQIEDNGTLTLRSDNPSYPAYSIKIDEVLEVWKGVLNISYLNKAGDLSFQNILQIMQELKREVADMKKN
ncbi:MAG: LexA family transcriptional regulator [Bacteroidetes bacterium]|nr:LexA family transcriptional regulator [Bacteroidota bacterium]